jgi:predicted nucleic acid-binding protein
MKPAFLDTNILVYAFDIDAGMKFEKAQTILKDCWNSQSGTLSTQVLQEFYVTVTRKLSNKVDKQSARNIVQAYKAWSVYSITPDDIIDASELEELNSLSFWDSLIIIAAQKNGAEILYSEDMQDGQVFGNLTVVNPFN